MDIFRRPDCVWWNQIAQLQLIKYFLTFESTWVNQFWLMKNQKIFFDIWWHRGMLNIYYHYMTLLWYRIKYQVVDDHLVVVLHSEKKMMNFQRKVTLQYLADRETLVRVNKVTYNIIIVGENDKLLFWGWKFLRFFWLTSTINEVNKTKNCSLALGLWVT